MGDDCIIAVCFRRVCRFCLVAACVGKSQTVYGTKLAKILLVTARQVTVLRGALGDLENCAASGKQLW